MTKSPLELHKAIKYFMALSGLSNALSNYLLRAHYLSYSDASEHEHLALALDILKSIGAGLEHRINHVLTDNQKHCDITTELTFVAVNLSNALGGTHCNDLILSINKAVRTLSVATGIIYPDLEKL